MLIMPNFTTGYPKRTGNREKDIENLNDWAVSLIDELKFLLANLDECNISEQYSEFLQNQKGN